MHIAVYDDNIADRKQTERLLGRESDRRKNECGEGHYIDSFGNFEALMHVPERYDLFLLDTSYQPETGLDIGEMLRKRGIRASIALLPNERYDYRTMAEEQGCADQYLYLNKPIRVSELHDLLEQCEILKGNPDPKVELRDDKRNTIYARECDIVYAVSEGGGKLRVKLSDGREVIVMETIMNLYDQCDAVGMEQIRPISLTALINIGEITQRNPLSVVMSDGTLLRVSPVYRLRFLR